MEKDFTVVKPGHSYSIRLRWCQCDTEEGNRTVAREG